MLNEYRRLLEKAEGELKHKDRRTREGAEFRHKHYKKEIKELEEKLAELTGEEPTTKKRKTRKKSGFINIGEVDF